MTTQSFDRTLSLRLDRLILQIEAGPPAVQKFALRLAKRYFERTVPTFGKRGAR
jgi:hypothetical protein